MSEMKTTPGPSKAPSADEVADWIACLLNPMPDMSGRQINRFHGAQRRRIEKIAAEATAVNATMFSALKAMDAALTREWDAPDTSDAETFLDDGAREAWIQIRSAISQADGQ